MIEVRLNVKDMPLDKGPEHYYAWLEGKLREAGIPVKGQTITSGILNRSDDPEDFGVTVYRWYPEST